METTIHRLSHAITSTEILEVLIEMIETDGTIFPARLACYLFLMVASTLWYPIYIASISCNAPDSTNK